MAEPIPECRSHKPDRSSPGNGSDRQASQLHIRSHCQDAEHYSSPPGTNLCACHIELSLGRLSNKSQKRRPGRSYKQWLDRIGEDDPRPPVDVWRDAVRRGHFGATRRFQTTPNSPKGG